MTTFLTKALSDSFGSFRKLSMKVSVSFFLNFQVFWDACQNYC